MQKAAGALVAEIRLKAQPASLDALAISDAVEDQAPHAPLCVRKLEEQLPLMARLLAIEALAAAQAVDLRRPARLGAISRMVYDFIREMVAPLEDDRETGTEAERVALALLGGELKGRLASFQRV
jgi:histidine ammonia-lyase